MPKTKEGYIFRSDNYSQDQFFKLSDLFYTEFKKSRRNKFCPEIKLVKSDTEFYLQVILWNKIQVNKFKAMFKTVDKPNCKNY